MFRKIINAILLIFAALFQISFLNNIVILRELNLILVLIIFVSLLDYKYGLYCIFFGVSVLELYSPYPAGLLFFSYFFTFLAVIWLFRNFFTNKSLYSLIIIGLLGTLCCNVFLYIFNESLFLLNISNILISLNVRYFMNLACQIICNLIGLSVLFIFFRTINKRMKAAFIMK